MCESLRRMRYFESPTVRINVKLINYIHIYNIEIILDKIFVLNNTFLVDFMCIKIDEK